VQASRTATAPTITGLPRTGSMGVTGPTAAVYDDSNHGISFFGVDRRGSVSPAGSLGSSSCSVDAILGIGDDLLVLCPGGLLALEAAATAAPRATARLTAAALHLGPSIDFTVDGLSLTPDRRTVWCYGRNAANKNGSYTSYVAALDAVDLHVLQAETVPGHVIESVDADGPTSVTALLDDGQAQDLPSRHRIAALPPGITPDRVAADHGRTWLLGDAAGAGVIVTPTGAQAQIDGLDSYLALPDGAGNLLAVSRKASVFKLLRVAASGQVTSCAVLPGQPVAGASAGEQGALLIRGPQNYLQTVALATCALGAEQQLGANPNYLAVLGT